MKKGIEPNGNKPSKLKRLSPTFHTIRDYLIGPALLTIGIIIIRILEKMETDGITGFSQEVLRVILYVTAFPTLAGGFVMIVIRSSTISGKILKRLSQMSAGKEEKEARQFYPESAIQEQHSFGPIPVSYLFFPPLALFLAVRKLRAEEGRCSENGRALILIGSISCLISARTCAADSRHLPACARR